MKRFPNGLKRAVLASGRFGKGWKILDVVRSYSSSDRVKELSRGV